VERTHGLLPSVFGNDAPLSRRQCIKPPPARSKGQGLRTGRHSPCTSLTAVAADAPRRVTTRASTRARGRWPISPLTTPDIGELNGFDVVAGRPRREISPPIQRVRPSAEPLVGPPAGRG